VAIVLNFADLCAAVSALISLAKRKSANAFPRGNVADSGMGGPNMGTSFDLVTATLENKKKVYDRIKAMKRTVAQKTGSKRLVTSSGPNFYNCKCNFRQIEAPHRETVFTILS